MVAEVTKCTMYWNVHLFVCQCL